MAKDIFRFEMKIERSLHKKLKQAAAEERRTLGAYLTIILEDHLVALERKRKGRK